MPNFTKISDYFYMGVSTDTKPTAVAVLTMCLETDTSKVFRTRNGTDWVEVPVNALGGIPFLPDYATTTDLAVSAQNAAGNVDIADVIGNKTDTVAGDSIIALLKAIKAKTDTIV